MRMAALIECHRRDLSIAIVVGDRAREGRAYGNLGIGYQSLGKFHQAIEYHSICLYIAKEVGDLAREGWAYGNLGIAYQSLGFFQRAIKFLEKDLFTAIELEDRAAEGRASCNLGIAYKNLGMFKEAIQFFKTSLRIAREVGHKVGEGRVYGNLGNVFNGFGKFQEAVECYSNCLSIAKEVGHRAEEGRAYCNLGIAYKNLGNFQEAMENHKKNLSIARGLGDRAGEGLAYSGLGNAHQSVGKFEEAIEYHNKDLSICRKAGDRVGEGRSYGNLGNAYVGLGKSEEALECYQSSVKIFDIMRASLQSEDVCKISFRDLHRDTYTALWGTLLALRRIDEALCTAEQARAQALVDDLKILYDLTELPSTSFEPKETISYISNELSTPTAFVGLQRNKIYYWVLSKGNKVEFKESKIESASLDEDSITVLLETTLKQIGAGVGVRCENRSQDEQPDDTQPNTGSYQELEKTLQCTNLALQSLHDAIIAPIAELCHGDELVIVPDGSLCLAPLSALSESIRIRTIPSLTTLKLIKDSPEDYHSKSGALLVGDPCLEKVKKRGKKPMYSPLPCAKEEVEMIGEILRIPPLTGTEATKQEVLERITSVALVHIAAHGRKETGEIALSPNPGWENDPDQIPRSKIKIPKAEDYMLKMSDVQGVKLGARLVVLSCCHSGRGDVKSEGVVGLGRAFLAAGARSVLVSLWAIDDEATMEFMKSFYQHLREGKSASVALHQAMKSLRDSEKFCAAKYWAPFVLIGDDVTLEFGENE